VKEDIFRGCHKFKSKKLYHSGALFSIWWRSISKKSIYVHLFIKRFW